MAYSVGDAVDSLDTPSMVVDLDLMEANIARFMDLVRPSGVRVRPHLKTTKSAAVARRLVAAGATGGCVAKLGEAEALSAAGFGDDLLITSEIVGAAKVRRLVALFRQHPGLRIVVDDAGAARAIHDALEAAGAPNRLAVLIDIDVGLHRTGVLPGAPALALARYVAAALPRLRIIGVQGYEGHLQHLHDRAARQQQTLDAMRALVATADLLRAEAGLDIQVVTGGGTGTIEFVVTVPGVTEVQPGSFLFMDTDYRNAIGPVYANSLTVLSTAVSQQGPRAVTIDAGLKSLTTDSGLAECRDPRYRYGVLGDEHGSLEWDDGVPPLAVGDRVHLVPSHIDPTVNLHEVYYAHRKGIIEEIWSVDSRGKVQ